MMGNQKIIAVVPAFNTERTIERTILSIPKQVDEILVVDDGSRDQSANIAKRCGAIVLVHPVNKGYGAAQKTGYAEALARGAVVIIMVHSDFQYDPTLVPNMVAPIFAGQADAVFGSRMHNKRDARRGGMPLWRFIANIGLTLIEESVLRLQLSEYHTGYRAYSRKVLETIPFEKNSNNYVFDTEMIAELKLGGFRVGEIPIPTRYSEDSCSPNFIKSCQYGFSTLAVLAKYIFHRLKIRQYPEFIMRGSVAPALAAD